MQTMVHVHNEFALNKIMNSLDNRIRLKIEWLTLIGPIFNLIINL